MEYRFNYQFTHKADSDLDDIVSYIAIELSNPKAASDFLDKLQAAIEEALAFPKSGPLVNNEFLQNHEIRKKFIGNYIMYYLPDFPGETIYILRIIYGKRNMDDILREIDQA